MVYKTIRDRIYWTIMAWVKPIMKKEMAAGRSRVIYDKTRKDSFKMAVCRKIFSLTIKFFGNEE